MPAGGFIVGGVQTTGRLIAGVVLRAVPDHLPDDLPVAAMAPAIFYLKGIAPPAITIHDMFRGVRPFIIVQVICQLIVAAFPQLVLWLPSVLLGVK